MLCNYLCSISYLLYDCQWNASLNMLGTTESNRFGFVYVLTIEREKEREEEKKEREEERKKEEREEEYKFVYM